MYHYHTKLMMKEPKTGGQWYWHQDYGYWYHNAILKPDMATCFMAIDKCTVENGCLEVRALQWKEFKKSFFLK